MTGNVKMCLPWDAEGLDRLTLADFKSTFILFYQPWYGEIDDHATQYSSHDTSQCTAVYGVYRHIDRMLAIPRPEEAGSIHHSSK